MELPDPIRKRLEDFSRNVLFDQSRTEAFSKDHDTFLPHDKRVLSSLQLQMSLYFNMWFFPLWWISETVMLQLKYPALPDYYKFILVTVLLLMTLIEGIRLYLGYAGNLQEKVPELAGFWLLSILLQFPLILFQLFNEAILIQPLERGVHIVLAIFILTQALSGFVALRDMVRHTESQFHLRQFD
ncbi:transmembrane protein 17B [Acanthochromis polyacanthus]|uniref:Transmembrane protein 17 n=1 Tax=Acanthochromis polyacanthus TaxID=80966 RepID=A0A3Q1GQ30_9TELE|nr:transmembrane protein 17B [Acanthochromis polyacanthus]